jgi:hypothetical protein
MSEYDFCQIEFAGGTKRLTCKQLGFDWPPPATMDFMGFEFKRMGYSKISDEDIETMSHVARGAMYVPAGDINKCACAGCNNDAVKMWGGRWHCHDCLPPMMKDKTDG